MKLLWIVRVELLTDKGLQPLQAAKVFESAESANKYQNDINQNPIYANIKAYAFCEPAIFVEE